MGKASKFFKALFSFKTSDPTHQPPPRSDLNKQPKRRWSFIKSNTDKLHDHHSDTFDKSHSRPRDTPLHHHSGHVGRTGSTNHGVDVSAATAKLAEAVVSTAHAAVEVVRLTNRATAGYGLRKEWAALKIQTYFRGYLSRKALRALKALVKLQALVRGQILRKQAAVDYRRLQTLLRVQARARAGRFPITDSPQSNKGPATPEKFEHILRTKTPKHDQSSVPKNNVYKSYPRYDDEKVYETDTVKHHQVPPRRRSLFSQSQSLTNSGGSTIHQTGFSPSNSCEVNSITTPFEEEVSFGIPENSPSFYAVYSKGNNGSMKVGPFTPAKSDSSRSCASGYSDHPNYMSYTESSRAKVRSVSAPRQRPQVEVSNSMKRYSVYGYGSGPGPAQGPQYSANVRDSFASKAYPGSGRLDRLGMPVGGLGYRESEYSGSYWNC